MDRIDTKHRSWNMSRIRGKDTKPELLVRKLIHSLGYRYRLHDRKLPGSPDIVFPSRRKIIFVNGCFWHRHNCRFGRVMPKTRRAFWKKKLEGNRDRDMRNRAELRHMDWRVFTIWECQLKRGDWLIDRIVKFLDS